MGLYPARRSDGGGRIAGGLEICLPPPEHSSTVYCNRAYYGPVSGDGAEDSVKGDQSVVGAGRNGCGGDADGGSGGGTDGGGVGYGGGGYRDELNWWEDTVANATLGTDPNDSIASAPGLELHHLIMSTLGDPIERLEIEREREFDTKMHLKIESSA